MGLLIDPLGPGHDIEEAWIDPSLLRVDAEHSTTDKNTPS